MWHALQIAFFFFFQAEDGIRDHAQSRGLGDVYKRQVSTQSTWVGEGPDLEDGLLLVPQVEGVYELGNGEDGEGHGLGMAVDPRRHGIEDIGQAIDADGEEADEGAIQQGKAGPAAGEEALARVAGLALHGVRVAGVDAQGKGRQDIGHEVHPEDVDGQEGRLPAHEDGAEDGEDLARVARQQEEDGLPDVVVDVAALGDGRGDGLEVVVHEDHVGRALGHVGSGYAHGHADIGRLEARRVVHAVARHGHDVAVGLEGLHDAHLVLGRDPREDADLADSFRELPWLHGVEVDAREHLVGRARYAELLGDGEGRVAVVARDHHGRDARFPAARDRVLHLEPRRVDHAHEAEEDEVALESPEVVALLRRRFDNSIGGSEDAEGIPRHAGHIGEDALAMCLGELLYPALPAQLRASPEEDVGSALREDDGARRLPVGLGQRGSEGMYRGHELPARVEGQLSEAGRRRDGLVRAFPRGRTGRAEAHAMARCELEQGNLRRVARGAALAEGSVVAERDALEEEAVRLVRRRVEGFGITFGDAAGITRPCTLR
eukprot:TRINITY_DN12395_c0_g1_i1.p2 TRINITY_DN12395_c0_g1~~TRINITY_DN12395_c0_g1_i1.p2  ORF type:complete len:547 (+),score=68.21 TRINITY_DN12395_c0_g1_i1:2-1642(+)